MNLDKATTYNPFLVVLLGHFNTKSCNWCINDKTNFEEAIIDTLTSQNALQKINKEQAHVLDTSSSRNDLFFTSQPKLVMDSGMQASLHVNCHHQIIFAKFDLQIYYPPSYKRAVCHYKHANTDHIRKAICGFNWERFLFANKDVN